MGRFKKLVESEEAMEKFVANNKNLDNVGLRLFMVLAAESGQWVNEDVAEDT